MYLDAGKYLKHVSRRILCKIKRLQRSSICSNARAFRENVDVRLTTKWEHILSTIPILTDDERQSMRLNASEQGIHEIYRQTSMFYNDYIQVRDFRKELENKYGRDVQSRKGNEIVFTTEQLLQSRLFCEPIMLTRTLKHPKPCFMYNNSTIHNVLKKTTT